MAAANSRPAQYRQTSRKGKKAWRKNIDLEDIEKSLQRRQEAEITHGSSSVGELKDDELFQIDTDGDEVVRTKLIKRKQIPKKLKSSEILDAIKTNSKVGALSHSKSGSVSESKKKIQGVSKKELRRLMALAGRADGKSKSQTAVAKDGLVRATGTDLWGEAKKIKTPSGLKLAAKSESEVPEELLKQSTTGWSQATVAPGTLKEAPLKVKEFESTPHAGKSYNPDSEDWSSLINKEYDAEKKKDDARIQLEQYQGRIARLMETIDANEEGESSSEDEEEEEAALNDGSEIKLSINKPVVNKKKTKHRRNKAKKHQKQVKLQKELKLLKGQVRELERLEAIEQEVAKKEGNVETGKRSKERMAKKQKLGTKHTIKEDLLEVKFADELSFSLRKLKPEGNLLYDTLRKLQSSGKVETRIPVVRGRRYKPKVTEKWTYKDFK
ncbi:LAMI_0F04742g1_1 [Lachancea mirantina]|uniref:Ribosome biogenesis protein NOP53 n=1 Tax=Lachancea mirantina TaxID=1230905 RepID=A0A1G4JXX8_9SACH|nr:LAMI_0F04742g1_1 [Lachancea mirantina]